MCDGTGYGFREARNQAVKFIIGVDILDPRMPFEPQLIRNALALNSTIWKNTLIKSSSEVFLTVSIPYRTGIRFDYFALSFDIISAS